MGEGTAYDADLGLAVPAELADDFLGKLHYVSEALSRFEFASPDRDRITFRVAEGSEGEAELIAERIAAVARKMCGAYRGGAMRVLVSRKDRDVPFAEDPHPLLVDRGDLVRYGSGRYGLGPSLVRLVDSLDRTLVRLAAEFEAEPWQFPSLVGAGTLHSCRYLQSFPHSLTLASHLREDLGAIQHFAQTVAWDDDHLALDGSDLAAPECLLSPTVCFHCYSMLEGRRLDGPKCITAVGKCFRYESGNLTGLERLWDFTMREIIFVGSPEYVLAGRDRTVERTVEILDSWGLAYEIQTATDPFFIDEFSRQTAFQSAFELKYEIRAALPYSGRTFAVGSFNYHQDFFGRSFDIGDASGAPLHTGCIGFGFERLALAFAAQYGPDPRSWPEAVRGE